MFSDLLSSFCFCTQQKTEKSSIQVDSQDKISDLSKNISTISQTKQNENYLNITYSQNKHLVSTHTHIGMNIKFDIPIKNPFTKHQSCKSNLVKIKPYQDNDENKFNQSMIRKKKFQQKIKDENEYFNNFQLKIDEIIDESLNIKSISESDDSELLSKK